MLSKAIAARNFSSSTTELKKTALYNFHKDTMKARIVPFAGYHMPVSYPLGGVAEHLHCRKSVGLFDVSHMGQVRFRGKHAKDLLERVTVVDTQALNHGQASLSMLMLPSGGIKDDCIITKLKDDDFYVVFNGACKYTDLEHINQVKDAEFKGKDVSIEYKEDRSLLAIQGPKSQGLLEKVLGY
jgi:aminomethyltransferase